MEIDKEEPVKEKKAEDNVGAELLSVFNSIARTVYGQELEKAGKDEYERYEAMVGFFWIGNKPDAQILKRSQPTVGRRHGATYQGHGFGLEVQETYAEMRRTGSYSFSAYLRLEFGLTSFADRTVVEQAGCRVFLSTKSIWAESMDG